MARASMHRDLTGITVLVVDDDDDGRAVLTETLEWLGATVVAAASADEGLSAYRASRPDVVVSDIRMPGRDGCWLLRELHREAGDVPALAVSAYVDEDGGENAARAGYREVLARPLEPGALASTVARLAGREAEPPERPEMVTRAGKSCAVTSTARCPYCGSQWLRALGLEPAGQLLGCRECSQPFYWR